MGTAVIVALPSVGDRVNKVSSEPAAHMTLAYLDDVDEDAMLYVQHAAEQLSPFMMFVDYRGTLGDKDADVLFFEKDKRVSEFRHWLLQNRSIRDAYDAVEQFEEWTPHLTLGYPGAPAREITDDDREIHYVDFDRIAVWDDDYKGPEFRLKYEERAMEVAMSDMSVLERGEMAATAIFAKDPDSIAQYGVKGMKWGVTTKDNAAKVAARQEVTVAQKKPGTFAKSEGGKGLPLHDDAKTALEARQKAKSSTTDALSNKELQAAVNRMRLEQAYSDLSFQSDRRSKGAKFAQALFGHKRYGGDKRKFVDFNEEMGSKVRDAMATKVGEAAKEKAKDNLKI